MAAKGGPTESASTGSEQHEVLLFGSIQEGILQTHC